MTKRPQGETMLLVLQAVMRPGLRPSMLEIAKEIGCQQYNVLMHLRKLRSMGLVEWEPQAKRTLRPTCRFIPAKELMS